MIEKLAQVTAIFVIITFWLAILDLLEVKLICNILRIFTILIATLWIIVLPLYIFGVYQ